MKIKLANLAYALIVLISACSDETTNPGSHSAEHAKPLPLQTRITDIITREATDSGNTYRVSVDPNQTYSIDLFLEVSPALTNGSLYIRIIAPNGLELLTRQTVLPDSTGYFEFSTGNHREVLIKISIQVRTTDFFQYQLAVYPASDNGLLQNPDSFEPNNTPSTGHYLGLQRTIDSALALGSLDHKDIYQFDVLTDETYTVEVSFTMGIATGADTGLRVVIVDELGRMLLTENKIEYQQTGYFEIKPLQTGKVYVAMYTNPLAQQRYYGYRIVVLPATSNGLVQDEWSLEPNNTLSTAYSINLGNTVYSDLAAGTEDHVDVFSIDVRGGEIYSLLLDNVTPIRGGVYNTLYVDIQESDGTVLLDEQWINNGESKIVEFVATQNTEALVRLTSHPLRFADSFQYHLRVNPWLSP